MQLLRLRQRVRKLVAVFSIRNNDCERPASPLNSPVPESGTTVTSSSNFPWSIMPRCCRSNVPLRPFNIPLTCSIAT